MMQRGMKRGSYARRLSADPGSAACKLLSRRSRGAVWPSTRPCQGRDRRFESGRDRQILASKLPERWPSPVEGDGLENRYRGNPIVGSNPTLSAGVLSQDIPDTCCKTLWTGQRPPRG